MNYEREERSTLRRRLLSRAMFNAKMGNLLVSMAESPISLAAFDAWMDGPWEPYKDGLCGSGLEFVAHEFDTGTDSVTTLLLYLDIFVDGDEA